jgi:hypothetical protein
LRFSWPFSTPAWLEKITIFHPSLWSCCNFVFTSGKSHFQSERSEGYFDWLFGTMRVPSKSKLAIFVLPFHRVWKEDFCHKPQLQRSKWRIIPWFQENSKHTRSPYKHARQDQKDHEMLNIKLTINFSIETFLKISQKN